ncbi:carbonic anhydrase 7-like [Anneissia japonica]|uniref:carbonic anhydrase 7-like n=1 Tax=Anneissia japonica TaxID=1529436 RepID=UPI0014259A02|nr:carbonic anhydrase 7-like [Anneissia japonica]
MLMRIFVASLVFIFANSSASNWSYEESTGPEHWGEIGYPICSGGYRQSPIDIPNAVIAPAQSMLPFELTCDWNSGRPLSITNNGHTVQGTLNGQYNSKGGPLLSTVFLAEQFHFHWGMTNDVGSEHTVRGQAYPAEMHIVHYDSTRFNNVSEAMNSNMGLAVFGFFIGISQDDNTAMQSIVQGISGLGMGQTKDVQTPFNLSSLLPMPLGNYWNYNGSLTTPPCYESVIWTVFETPITISQTQMDMFRQLGDSTSHPIINNFRPIMNTNQRPIIYNV